MLRAIGLVTSLSFGRDPTGTVTEFFTAGCGAN